MFLGRTVIQPLLLDLRVRVRVPEDRRGDRRRGGAARFSTLLVGGVIASSMIFQGVQAVALPLVQDFGYTREIEDRVLAPMPVWAVAFEKVASGAIQAVIASLVVFVLATFIPATPVHLSVHWLYLVTLLPLVGDHVRGARSHDRHPGRAPPGAVDLQPARHPDDVPRRGLLPVAEPHAAAPG